MQVVPEPQKGSNTTSPSRLYTRDIKVYQFYDLVKLLIYVQEKIKYYEKLSIGHNYLSLFYAVDYNVNSTMAFWQQMVRNWTILLL